MTPEKEIQKLKEQLVIAMEALKDIKNWDDDLADEWDDEGYRAKTAIHMISNIESSFN